MTVSYEHLQALAPLGIIALAPLLLVMLDAILMREGREARERALGPYKGFFLTAIAASCLILALFAAWLSFENATGVVALSESMFVVDRTASFAIALLCVTGLLTLCHSLSYSPAREVNHGEYFPLLMLAIAGSIALVSAGNLISLFVAIELMVIPAYVLVGFDRSRTGSGDAGMTALLSGSFASALSLYGIALIYGATGHFDYPGIRTVLDSGAALGLGGAALAGIALLLVGVLTRQGVAPFHQWLPDLTQAAPGVVALFVPTLLVTAAAFALIRIVDSIAPVSLPAFGAMFSMLSVVSMVVGSVMALVQSNIKRMLAYGGVAHAGFLLAAVNVQTAEGRAAALFHITVFLFMQVGVLGAISAISGAERTRKTWELLSDYTGLAASRPILAAAMTIFLVALAGLPGTSGFMSRFIVMSAVVGDGQMLVTLAMTISSMILFAAYLRVPTAMYMGHTVADDPDALPIPAVFALSVCAIVTIYLGLFPGPGPASFETLDIVRRAVQP